MKASLYSCVLVALVLGGCPEASQSPSVEGPGSLQAGYFIPAVTLRALDGSPVDLRQAVAKQPTVLIFYRGGWCPYCNRHLVDLEQLEPQLKDLGYQILAVSPDRPEELARSTRELELGYELLSDSDMVAARAFGLAFKVDDALVETYKTQYGIDLEGASGRTHHELPVPAAYVVDSAGLIHFAYANPDYKVRVDSQTLLDEATAAVRE